MPTLDQIAQALKAADAAGNTEDARRLAQAYKQMRDSQTQAAPSAPEQPAQPQAQQNDSGELSLSDLITGRRPKPTAAQQIGRQFTMAGRNIVHGLASIPGVINDPIVNTLNYAEDKLGVDPKYRLMDTAQTTDYALNKAGVPDYQPQNGTERVVGRIEQGLGGVAGGAGLGSMLGRSTNAATQGIGNALKDSLGKQAAATVSGTSLGGLAHESGAGPKTELAASLLGGLSPVGVEGAVAGTTRGLTRLFGAPDGEVSRLAKLAQAEGIPLKASQISDSRVAKLVDSATGQVPFSGARKFRAAQQDAFNRAAGKTIGIDATKVTPQSFNKAVDRISGEFDRLTADNSIPITKGLTDRLNVVAADAGAYYGPEAKSMVEQTIQRLVEQSQNGVIPGRVFQSIDSKLGSAVRSGGERSAVLGELQDALRDAMEANLKPSDVKAWQTARRQWRDMLTLEPIVAKSATGDISPSQLMGRVVADRAGKRAMARGKRGDLGDLARIGQLIKDTVPDSGTAPREAVNDVIKGVAKGAAGSALTGAAYLAPAATGVSALAAVALSRRVQNILKNPRLVNTMLKNPNLDPTLRQALEASINPGLQSLPNKGQ